MKMWSESGGHGGAWWTSALEGIILPKLMRGYSQVTERRLGPEVEEYSGHILV